MMVFPTKIAWKFDRALDSQGKANRWLAVSIGTIETVRSEIHLCVRSLGKTVNNLVVFYLQSLTFKLLQGFVLTS